MCVSKGLSNSSGQENRIYGIRMCTKWETLKPQPTECARNERVPEFDSRSLLILDNIINAPSAAYLDPFQYPLNFQILLWIAAVLH